MPYYDYVIRKDNPVGLVQGYKSLGFYTVDDFNVSADGVWTLKDGIPDNTVCNYSAGCAKAYKLPAGQKAFPGMYKFADVDNDGTVASNDVTIIGKTKPSILVVSTSLDVIRTSISTPTLPIRLVATFTTPMLSTT